MSEIPPAERKPKRPNNFVGWLGASGAAAAVNFIVDPNFDSEVQNSLFILGGGILASVPLSALRVPSPFIAYRKILVPAVRGAVKTGAEVAQGIKRRHAERRARKLTDTE